MKDNKLGASNKNDKYTNNSSLNNKSSEDNYVENSMDYISGDAFPTSTSHKFNRITREEE